MQGEEGGSNSERALSESMGRGVCCQCDALLPSPADLPPPTCFVGEESAHVLQVDPAVRREGYGRSLGPAGWATRQGQAAQR